MSIPFVLTAIQQLNDKSQSHAYPKNNLKIHAHISHKDIGPFMNMSLDERDKYVYDIDCQIEKKKKLLWDKRAELERKRKENDMLRGVQDDYARYNDALVKEKRQNMDAMKKIQEYLDALIVDGQLTDEDISRAKKEQDRILAEITKIKMSLDEIIGPISDNKVN